jgi:deoxyribodipyrimidine photolyase
MKTLVWLTHSFRTDSRLTSKLSGQCTFVYYSPFYFAGEREREILRNCSQENLDAFYQTLDQFNKDLKEKHNRLYVFKKKDPIEHMNWLCEKYGFERIVIDQPLFAMWHTIDLLRLNVPYEFIDSDLVDDKCFKMTAKSRWMTHVKGVETFKSHEWNSEITRFSLDEPTASYPEYKTNWLVDSKTIQIRARAIAPRYGETRDSHRGQTRLSTSFQNGVTDPHNVFFSIAKDFLDNGADFTKNEGLHAAMLRQFAFREITIIQARRANLTMEDHPMKWAEQFVTPTSLQNLKERTNSESTLTLDKIKTATTGDALIDQILSESFSIGVMPNRARMFYAGWLFYNAPTGQKALEWLIDTFDLLLVDGQCPTNYTQSTSSMNMQYGRVMLLNRDRVKQLLDYEN